MSTVVKKTKRNKSGLFYSKKEEYINSFSHIAGAVGCIAACGVYLQRCHAHGDKWAVAGMWLMLAGMLFSYLSSSVYHSLKHHNPLKKRFRQFDHAAIYWHIAGCYSPITLTVLREQGAWGWSLFAFVWLCTIAGTIVSFREMETHSHIETVCYVVMGLSVVVAFKPLYSISPSAVYWILAEGFFDIAGAAIYSFKSIRYAHSIFHFFILAASVCHFVAVWQVFDVYFV